MYSRLGYDPHSRLVYGLPHLIPYGAYRGRTEWRESIQSSLLAPFCSSRMGAGAHAGVAMCSRARACISVRTATDSVNSSGSRRTGSASSTETEAGAVPPVRVMGRMAADEALWDWEIDVPSWGAGDDLQGGFAEGCPAGLRYDGRRVEGRHVRRWSRSSASRRCWGGKRWS